MSDPQKLPGQDEALAAAIRSIEAIPEGHAESHMTAMLVVYMAALWGTFGTEYARSFIEAQLLRHGRPSRDVHQEHAMSEPLLKLLDACDDSEGSQYGTLSTAFVRQLVNEALAKPSEAPAGTVEPVAWATEHSIKWALKGTECTIKLTRKKQPEHGFTVPLYTSPSISEGARKDAARYEWLLNDWKGDDLRLAGFSVQDFAAIDAAMSTQPVKGEDRG